MSEDQVLKLSKKKARITDPRQQCL